MYFKGAFLLRHIVLFEACLLQYTAFTSADSTPFLNTTTSQDPSPKTGVITSSASLTSSLCGSQTCTVRLFPTTVSYPFPLDLRQENVTATVIPIVYTYANGSSYTTSSIYEAWNPTSNATWVPPPTTTFTWSQFGTTLTYPTTYIAYPTPTLILHSTLTARGGIPTCAEDDEPIPVPPESTSKLVFPSTPGDPTPETSKAYYLVDGLPALTSLLNGGDPRTCFHGVPQPARETPAFGIQPQVHTTVSVLTQTGLQVTLAADPFGGQNGPGGGGAGASNGGGSGGQTGDPQQQQSGGQTGNGGQPTGNGAQPTGTGTGSGSNPGSNGGSGSNSGSGPGSTAGSGSGNSGSGSGSGSSPLALGPPVTVNGEVITPAASGAVVIEGQTFSAGAVGVVGSSFIPLSVGTTSGIVILGGSTVTLPTVTGTGTETGAGAGATSKATSSGGVGAAVASGIGANKSSAYSGHRVGAVALEACALVTFLIFLGCL
ncbi:hypothetical protein BT63DRAFT_310895 [Microthyrium microscopicum]|uniref:Uncharacterized protein n=1 Tax=Microthyrium microscopicum TaxID=703497 RepID=A0A6A6U2L0_9PEZI|nr:hypothetical protein BT63DRAFT_310895 [Microthyrium microscopicum]